MEEMFREMSLSLCRQNATTNTTDNVTCEETNDEILGWMFAAEFDVLRNPVVAAVVVVVYVVVIVVGSLGSLLVFVKGFSQFVPRQTQP